ALILPIFMMILVGFISSAQVYNRKLDISHAVREGARYGSTLPTLGPFSTTGFTCPSSATGGPWAAAIKSVIVDRSAGDLTCAQVLCVALVRGSPGLTITFVTGTAAGLTCYSDASGTDGSLRVHVQVDRGTNNSADKIQALLFSVHVHLRSTATAKYET